VKALRNSSSEKDIWSDLSGLPCSSWTTLQGLPEKAGVGALRIAVAAGGVGPEREVSLGSGAAVYEALRQRVPRTRFVDVKQAGGRNLRSMLRGIDLAFVVLHGPYGEDGRFQQALDAIGMPYTGSGPEASRTAFDKILSRECFLANGIDAAEGVHLSAPKEVAPSTAAGLVFERLGLPVVIKPACSGSSVGVAVVREREGLEAAIEDALAASPSDRKAIVAERFVAGKEVTVGVLAGRALPVVGLAPANEFYDYEAKYLSDGTHYEVPASLDKETAARLQEIGLAAFNTLGCRDYARIDFIVGGDGTPFILEANTLPGMTSHSLLPKAAQVVGLDFPTLVTVMAALAVERARRA
jgi:D-alanine-D-alanine ligase